MVVPHVSTYFTWLDAIQRKEFRARWEHLNQTIEKWCDRKPGETIKIFAGNKALEKEIKDLEDISFAAYRAMKYLRKELEENKTRLNEHDDYSG